jgi:hydroxymethylpyrimidine/phosphomethylpyrimidine kinase
MNHSHEIPIVMTLNGNDPTGSGGMQADIEAIISHGCHAAPVITCLTVQDTNNLITVMPVNPGLLIQQARAVLEDVPVTVIKIGLLGSTESVEAAHSVLVDYPKTPLILDPVLSTAGDDQRRAEDNIAEAINALLLPLATIVTPSAQQALTLAPEADNADAAAMALLDRGAEFVLITGAKKNAEETSNVLYTNNRTMEAFKWQRLPEIYHGYGSTLAASIAGLLAQGHEPFSAIHEAQQYTWRALKQGYRIGMGRLVPNRLFWVGSGKDDEETS